MRWILFILVNLAVGCAADAQRRVGGPCEGCEALLEYGSLTLNNTTTLTGFAASETKLKITGVIYKNDGITPAQDIILYVYQTDEHGIYPSTSASKGWERRHGYIRGWIKTDSDGRYVINTFRPGAYPNRKVPEHVHLTVKEPDTNPYYIDAIHFQDDPLLTSDEIESFNNRGGPGVIVLIQKGDLLVAHRDIILGQNIPGY